MGVKWSLAQQNWCPYKRRRGIQQEKTVMDDRREISMMNLQANTMEYP